MTSACLGCLTRARLLVALAGRIELLSDSKQKTVRTLLALTNDELFEATGVAAKLRPRMLRTAELAAADDADKLIEGGAVCIHSDAYPARLRQLDDPPHALFYTGPLERLQQLTADKPVAIVGARRASPQGLQAAYNLGRELAAADVTVVSGMAFGIDAECHRGALDGGDAVLAVLASGADRPSPKRNSGLYRRLRATGSIVSEMPWGAEPLRWQFPARNRIMAAISEMTVVVEAAAKSGSLITSTFATDLGRLVGAMPGTPGARLTSGNNELLYDGGVFVRDVEDVLERLYDAGSGPERRAIAARRRLDGHPELSALLDALEVCASFEELGERTGLPARELRAALAKLERAGLVRRRGLQGYVATTAGLSSVPMLGAADERS